MLLYLTLNQFALIVEHEVRFVDGFNVITGETGAGKSLLLEALSLCMGGRADSSMVRHGAEHADLYAEFDVMGNEAVQAWFEQHERKLEDNSLLIRRQLSSNGRSKAWLNGLPVSLSELKSLGQLLVNIHSQHAQQALLKPQFVIQWLDSMAGLEMLANETKQAYQRHAHLKRQQTDLTKADAHRQDRIALLQNQLNDIEPLLDMDYASIEAEHEELSNIEALMQEAALAVQLLNNDGADEPDAMGLLGRAIRLCDNQVGVSSTFEQASELLYLAQQQISEASNLLADYAEQQLPDPERLYELNNLMALSHRLSRKYNTTPEALIDESQAWQKELEQLLSQPSCADLQAQINQAWQMYLEKAERLSKLRRQAAAIIEKQLMEQVRPLALPNARCEFEFLRLQKEHEYHADGIDAIELLFSANVGMPMQPLYKIASGGELSRMALVMQVLQATQTDSGNAHPMLVFDEVDVGISGGTAQIVGELLRKLGKRQQLLAITHQAQVAAQAHQHILVQKQHENQSQSILTVITEEEQVEELARMSGGVTISNITRDHARSLLSNVK